jgi:hypothetical protein
MLFKACKLTLLIIFCAAGSIAAQSAISGKVLSSFDAVRMLALGADGCNAAPERHSSYLAAPFQDNDGSD